jgi:hypothetical protein
MKSRTHAGVVPLALAMAATGAMTVAPAASAVEARPAARTITAKLDGPFGLQRAVRHRGFVVAESVSGQVTRVFLDGRKRAIINGAPGVAGVAAGPRRVFAVLGGPDENGQAPAGKYGPSTVIRSTYDGRGTKVIADLGKYELAHNPDGQVQFVDGKPVDALSNPFAMTASRYGLIVADGGANDVLRVNSRTGHVSTFFVPHTVRDVKACLAPGAQSNPGTVGCDPVPTGVAVSRGSVYVSTLGAEQPGAGRVYKLDERTGKVQRVWRGLTSPTGIAVRPDGTVFVSEVLHGAPAGDGPPPPGFDPRTVGRITKISHGRMTHAQVTMPTGLQYTGGSLYAAAWSIADFLGLKHKGQVVKVRQGAFH